MVGSTAPVGSKRVILARVTPLSELNWPPTMMRLSACRAMVSTVPLMPGLAAAPNAVSKVPLEVRRAMWPAATALTLVKSPPIRMLPSNWMAMARTAAPTLTFWLKLVSKEPLELRRTRLATATPLKLVNEPPTRTWPALATELVGYAATAYTVPLAPPPTKKDGSTKPLL